MTRLKYIVDRIEDGFAVCERDDLTMENIPLKRLPENVHEGSVLGEKNGEFFLDVNEEEQRRRALFDLQNSLFDEA